MPTGIQLFFVWLLPVPAAALVAARNSTNSTAQEQYAMVTEVAQKFKGKYYISFPDTADAAFEERGVTEFPFIAVHKKGEDKKRYVYGGEMSAHKITQFIEDVDAGQVEPLYGTEQSLAYVGRRLQSRARPRPSPRPSPRPRPRPSPPVVVASGRRRGKKCTKHDQSKGRNEKGQICDSAPRTQKGCECRKVSITEKVDRGNEHSSCGEYCCNPDGRAGGNWCFVKHEICEGSESGTCDQGDEGNDDSPASTPAPDEEGGGGGAGGAVGGLVLLCCCCGGIFYWRRRSQKNAEANEVQVVTEPAPVQAVTVQAAPVQAVQVEAAPVQAEPVGKSEAS